MVKKNPQVGGKASPIWTELDAFMREQIQDRFQELLEAEVTEWLGRPKSVRRDDGKPGEGTDRGGEFWEA